MACRQRPSAAGFKFWALLREARRSGECTGFWFCEIEASRAAKTRCFLASCSLMGRKTAAGRSRLRWGVGAACAGAVCFPAALLAAAAPAAPAAPTAPAATAAPAATPFAGRLHLLLQCLPGFLLPLLCRCSSPTSDSKIQSDNKQRTGRRAVRQGNESAAGIGDYQPRAARSSAISGLTRPIFLTKSSEFGPRTSLGKADGPRTRTNPAAFDCR